MADVIPPTRLGEQRAAPDRAERFIRYVRTRDVRLRNELVVEYHWLAERYARRFRDRGEQLDDLRQVAHLGLIKAVERFDPDRGYAFESFATPTIMGEIKRHFRDATWAISVPRRPKELRGRVHAATETLSQGLARMPTPEEIAEEAQLDRESVVRTQIANRAYRCTSFEQHAAANGDSIERMSPTGSVTQEGLAEAIELRVEAMRAIGALSERDRKILLWRFYEECTQREIGDRLGIGQVQVSRLLTSALAELRGRLTVASDGSLTSRGSHDPEPVVPFETRRPVRQ